MQKLQSEGQSILCSGKWGIQIFASWPKGCKTINCILKLSDLCSTPLSSCTYPLTTTSPACGWALSPPLPPPPPSSKECEVHNKGENKLGIWHKSLSSHKFFGKQLASLEALQQHSFQHHRCFFYQKYLLMSKWVSESCFCFCFYTHQFQIQLFLFYYLCVLPKDLMFCINLAI